MKKVFLTTTFKLCDNNGYLGTQLSNFFSKNGFERVFSPEQADVMVISTCGFDQERENASVAIVDQYIKNFGKEKDVIVCGCLPKINPDIFKQLGITVIGPKEMHRFNERFNAAVRIEDVTGSRLDEAFISKEYGFLDTYYLQICQGCRNNCSYCGIKKAKGGVKSKTIATILRELEEGIKKGYSRVMLLGDDCGSYGMDIGTDLSELLNVMARFDIRIHINYIEPGEFKDLYMKINPDVLEKIDFINIPVQTTSERILQLMNRRYDSNEIMEIVRTTKKRFPHIFMETHVILGFPSETIEEFRDTFRLSKVFDSTIYFYYTDRKNVQSASFAGKIPAHEMIRRTQEVIDHPQFSWQQSEKLPPLVLLGYSMSKEALFDSIEKNCLTESV